MQKICEKIVKNPKFEFLSFGFIVLTLLVFTFSTEFHSQNWLKIFRITDYIFGVAFVVEYIIRILSSKKRLTVIFRPMMILDLIVIISVFYPARYNLSFLRLLKLFRFLKSKRFKTAKTVLQKVWKSEKEELALTLIFFFSMIFMLSSLAYIFEGESETFSSILRCIYWAVITATSVGYGDVVPVTIAGKITAIITAVMGLATYSMMTAIFASGFTTEMKKLKKRG